MVDRDCELDSVEQQIQSFMLGSDLTLEQRSSLRKSIYGLSYDCPNLLHGKYREIITNFITIKVLPSITETKGDLLLNQVGKGFEDLMYGMSRISGYFRVLDKVANEKYLPSLKEVVITCFRDMVFDTYKVQAKDSIIQLIEREREGDSIERSLVEYGISIFVDVGHGSLRYYIDDFENHLIANCKAYYNQKVSGLLLESPMYLYKETRAQLDDISKEENDRISCYLHVTSGQNIFEIVRTSLLAACSAEWLMLNHSVCHSLFKENKVEDLAGFYQLFSKNDDILKTLAQMFRLFIVDQGVIISMEIDDSTLCTDTPESLEDPNDLFKWRTHLNERNFQDAKVYIWKIAELYETCSNFLTKCFMSDIEILMHMSMAFNFCTDGVAKSYTVRELLHSCINDMLNDRNAKMDKLLTLCKLVKNMDYLNTSVFYKHYRRQLAVRLLRKLTDHDENLDNEKLVLENILFASHMYKEMVDWIYSTFANQCAVENQKQITENLIFASSKMNQMVAEIARANDLCHQLNSDSGIEMELNVTVLNAFNWPMCYQTGLVLPKKMKKAVRTFGRMFANDARYQFERKLNWDHNVGSVVLDLKFDDQVIEFEVSPAQAAILVLFNDCDKLSYSGIRRRLHLSEPELENAISPLSCGEYEVLVKHPKTNEFSTSDVFEFNSKFTHHLTRIKVIPQPSSSWICEDEICEYKNLKDLENYKVACIVRDRVLRLLKEHGCLKYSDLLKKCVDSLPDVFEVDNRGRYPLLSRSDNIRLLHPDCSYQEQNGLLKHFDEPSVFSDLEFELGQKVFDFHSWLKALRFMNVVVEGPRHEYKYVPDWCYI